MTYLNAPPGQLPRRLVEHTLARPSAVGRLLGDLLDAGKHDHYIYQDTSGNLVLSPERRPCGALQSLLGLFVERRLVPDWLYRHSLTLREARACVPVADPRQVLSFIEQGLHSPDATPGRFRSDIQHARVAVFGALHVVALARSWIPSYGDLRRERDIRAQIQRVAPDLTKDRRDQACARVTRELARRTDAITPDRITAAVFEALNHQSVWLAVTRLAQASGWDERDIEPIASVACGNGAALHEAFHQQALGDDHALVHRLAAGPALEQRAQVLARTLDVDRPRALRVAAAAQARSQQVGRAPQASAAEFDALVDDLLDSSQRESAMGQALAQLRRESPALEVSLRDPAVAAVTFRLRQHCSDTLAANRKGFLDSRPLRQAIGERLDTVRDGLAERLLEALHEEVDLLQWQREVDAPTPGLRTQRAALEPLVRLLEQHLVGACDLMGMDLARQPDVAARQRQVRSVYPTQLALGLQAVQRGLAALATTAPPADLAARLQQEPGMVLREAFGQALRHRAGSAPAWHAACARVQALLHAGTEDLVRASIAANTEIDDETRQALATLLTALRFAAADGAKRIGQVRVRDRSRPLVLPTTAHPARARVRR